MSCHNIGRGLNWVVDEIVLLYDAGAYDRATAVNLLSTAVGAVTWCDGNQGEVYATQSGYRCGLCLKKLEDEEPVFSIYRLSWELRGRLGRDYNDFVWTLEHKIGFADLCSDCFDKVLGECSGDPNLGPAERAHQLEHDGIKWSKASAQRDRTGTRYWFERRREYERQRLGQQPNA